MKKFQYVIQDELGIHARPAGLLSKLAKTYAGTEIVVSKGDKSAKSTQLMRLMNLGIKQGDEVTVTIDGPAENEAFTALQTFFAENL